MVAFEQKKDELEALGISVFAGSVDTGDHAEDVAGEVSFPVAQGVSREIGEKLGSWWEERRQIVQPTEFVMRGDGTIINASYSDGPLARTDAGDVCGLVSFIKKS